MNDSPLPPVSADASRRKMVAMVVVGSCCAIMAVAFMAGGKKAPVIKDIEKDPAVGIVQDGVDFQMGGSNTPDDWLNAPEGSLADSGAGGTTATAPGKKESAVVAGDVPAASPTVATSAQTGSAPATTEQPAVQGSGTQTTPASSTVAATHNVAGTQPKTKPAAAPAGTGAQTAVANAPASATPAAMSSPGKVAAAKTTPQKAPAQSKAQRPGTPVFVRPKTKRPGLIAQTHSLITHEELAAAAPQAVQPATQQQDSKTKPAPARVRQEEARAFAQKTTEAFRQQGALTPTQHVRLPRSTEAASKKIWREDDKPATAEERRPFGLVVVDEKTAVTPEGIPLRTDIPAGASPLEKTGADKPLWKRPE